MKTARLLGLAGFLIALHPLVGASTRSEAAPLITRLDSPVSIHAEISGHQMFVNIMVNGHGPFRVMVDTGCSVTLVSPELAEAVGATIQDDDENFLVAQNGLGDSTEVERVVLGIIDLGGARFEGVPAAISDSFEKLSMIEGRRVDGALGFPLFADLFLGFDFPNQRLLLGRDWPANAPAIRATLPMIEHADVPFVQVNIQGRPIEVMIDTGANQALQLPVELASQVEWKVEPRAGAMVAVIGEVGREEIGRLAGSLALGNIQQVEPTAVISSGPPSIGLRSLEQFCVIFRESENKVWICGTALSPIMPAAERSNGLSIYSDPGGWRIAGVIPGSPAEEAHLTAGALVTMVEGRPAMSWTRDQIEQWTEAHSDIALVVAEQSGERALRLRAWNLVP